MVINIFNEMTYVSLRATSIQEPFGAPAVPEGRGRVPRPEEGLETRRTGAGRVGDRGEWQRLTSRSKMLLLKNLSSTLLSAVGTSGLVKVLLRPSTECLQVPEETL